MDNNRLMKAKHLNSNYEASRSQQLDQNIDKTTQTAWLFWYNFMLYNNWLFLLYHLIQFYNDVPFILVFPIWFNLSKLRMYQNFRYNEFLWKI